MIADVRAWKEYTGVSHDYTYMRNLGRIPGALWAGWGPSTYRGGDFWGAAHGADGEGVTEAARELPPVLNAPSETAAVWAERGIDGGSGRRIIFSCGSGWRVRVHPSATHKPQSAPPPPPLSVIWC